MPSISLTYICAVGRKNKSLPGLFRPGSEMFESIYVTGGSLLEVRTGVDYVWEHSISPVYSLCVGTRFLQNRLGNKTENNLRTEFQRSLTKDTY